MTRNLQINEFSINESWLKNIAYLYEEFQDTIEIWTDMGVWNLSNEHVYSSWLKKEILSFKISLSGFVENGFSQSITKKHFIDNQFLRLLLTSVMKHGRIIPALIQVNGWRGKLGLELAKAHIIEFFESTGRIPVRNDGKMNRIRMAAVKGYWKEFGIQGWNDLLYSIFGRVTKKMNFYTGKEGLHRAKNKILKFYENNNRIPTVNDKEMASIQTACLKNYWKKYGVSNWNDLLEDTLGMKNKEVRIYVGLKGLNYAKKELLKFYEDYDRIPIAKDMLKMQHAFKGKYWVKYGVKKWNDLQIEVFNEVNTQPNFYKGIKGLYRAKEIIKEFYIKNGRRPTSHDSGISGIYEAARKGYWIDKGISSWHELLSDIFSKEELTMNSGLIGFNKACKKITDYYEENKSYPVSNDFDNITKYYKNGKWKRYDVNNWDDLLNFNFGDVNQRKSGTCKYIGLKGVNLIKKEITDFYQLHGRKPKRNEFSHIDGIWNYKLWKAYGFKTWKNLLYEIFGEIDELINTSLRKKGLEKATIKLKKYYDNNNRKPQAKEFNTIALHCSRGHWTKFEIYSWNDLLKNIFGTARPRGIWKGNTGLRKAKDKIWTFYKKNGRMPNNKDKGMGGISNAAGRKGYWRMYGIKSWNQLKKVVFEESKK